MKLLLLTIFNLTFLITNCQDINRLYNSIFNCKTENTEEIKKLADSIYTISPADETATYKLVYSYSYHEEYDSISFLFKYLKNKNPKNYKPFLLSAKLIHPTVSQEDTLKILELLTAEKLEPMNIEIKYLLGESYYSLFYQTRSNFYAVTCKSYFLSIIALDDNYINSLRYPLLQLAHNLKDTMTLDFLREKKDIYAIDRNNIPLENASYFPITKFLSLPENWEYDYNYAVLWDIENITNSLHFYSSHLRSRKEPILFKQTTKTIYRLSFFPSFHSGISIRIEKTKYSQKLYWKYNEYKASKNETTFKLIQKSKNISNFHWNEFNKIIDSLDFWKTQTISQIDGDGKDGTIWLLEGIKDNGYHIIERWSPDYRNYYLKRCSDYLIKLTDLKIKID